MALKLCARIIRIIIREFHYKTWIPRDLTDKIIEANYDSRRIFVVKMAQK